MVAPMVLIIGKEGVSSAHNPVFADDQL